MIRLTLGGCRMGRKPPGVEPTPTEVMLILKCGCGEIYHVQQHAVVAQSVNVRVPSYVDVYSLEIAQIRTGHPS